MQMGLPFQRRQDLRNVVPKASKKGLDLLKRTLTWAQLYVARVWLTPKIFADEADHSRGSTSTPIP